LKPIKASETDQQSLVNWPLPVVNEFSSMVTSKLLCVNFINKNDLGIFNIEAFIKNKSVSDLLVERELATLSCVVDTNCAVVDSKNRMRTNSLPVELNESKLLNNEYEVTVVVVKSPFCFYVQLNETLDSFNKFESEMHDFYSIESNVVRVEKPSVGDLCIAKFSEDQLWYRAVIKQVDIVEKTALVFFVDYGNEETVSTSDNSLIKIDSQHSNYEYMAINCCLNGIKPMPQLATRLAEMNDFIFLKVEEKVTAQFVEKHQLGNCFQVNLFIHQTDNDPATTTKTSLADLLIEKNFVSKDSNSAIRIKKDILAKTIKVNSDFFSTFNRFHHFNFLILSQTTNTIQV
jgi:hypothetical protein